MPAEMTREQLDATLQRLRDAADRVSDNLLELELDPIRTALDETPLTGESAFRWERAAEALAELWQWYGALNGVLERASDLRAARGRPSGDQRAELEALLGGQSIAFQSHNVPLDQRELLGASVATQRCTPDELLARMASSFDDAKAVIAAVQRAWEGLRPRLSAASRQLDDLGELSATLGEPEPSDVAPLRERIAALGDTLAADPLAADAGVVDEIDARIAALHADLDGIATLARTLPERLALARALLDDLRAEQRAGADAHAEATLKIAAPEVPAPDTGDDRLDDDLVELAALVDRASWRAARDGLEDWTRRATERRERAARIARENRAPIQARNELRGLLDAYRGKVRLLGLIEDPHLARLYADARDVLYTAPTDLAMARALVRRYQETIPGGRWPREGQR